MTMSKRDRILLAIIAAVAVIGGAYWFLIKPARAEATAKRDQLAALEADTGVISDQITRLKGSQKDADERSVEGFRLAKAVPDRMDTAGAIIQLQRIADQADVNLAVLRTSSVTNLGTLSSTELEVRVRGKFFDVSDFMFRAHRLVRVDEQAKPNIDGRLYAFKNVRVELEPRDDTTKKDAGDTVEATLNVLLFSAPPVAPTTAAGAAQPAAATTGGTP